MSKAAREAEGRRRWLAKAPRDKRAALAAKLITLEYARRSDVRYAASLPSRAEARAALRVLEAWDRAGAFHG